jgi:hypothetical protein
VKRASALSTEVESGGLQKQRLASHTMALAHTSPYSLTSAAARSMRCRRSSSTLVAVIVVAVVAVVVTGPAAR